MKKIIIFTLLLFLFIGAVSANNDSNTTLSENTQELAGINDSDILKINETDAEEIPTISSSDVVGTPGKTITLKTTVKDSNGPISGKTVIFKLNGNNYTAVSDNEGVASVDVICPNSAVLKTTDKIKSKTLTKTITYSKTYTCTVSIGDAENNFKVVSKKDNIVKKYKISKKVIARFFKVKKGEYVYNIRNYDFKIVKLNYKKFNRLGVSVAGKYEGFVKFYISTLIKKNGVWVWDKWFKVPKNKKFDKIFPKNTKLDIIKIKYTHMNFKLIK